MVDNQAVELALGRIFRIMSRPFQAGDAEEYERCRAIIFGELEPSLPDYRPNYARDYNSIIMSGD